MNKSNMAWLTSTIILFGMGTYLHLYQPIFIPLRNALNEFPSTIGQWTSDGGSRKSEPFAIQGTDAELYRVYKDLSGDEIRLYIGYFASQRQDKKLIYYRHQMLYNGTEEIEIPLSPRRSIMVNKTVLKDDDRTTLILYWYDLNGKIVANRYKTKFITAFDGITRGRTNGAFILISSNLTHSCDMQTILNEETEFVKMVLPVLNEYLP